MTTRRLIVMRHAKSSWESGVTNDWERPINDRGRRDAPRIAARLVELGWTPDAVRSSDATRTRHTFEGMAAYLRPEPDVVFENGLYLGDLESIRASALDWDASWRTVLVLGHNPGWEDAVTQLVGETVGMTTANAALLEGEGEDWPRALLGRWRLEQVLRPKEM